MEIWIVLYSQDYGDSGVFCSAHLTEVSAEIELARLQVTGAPGKFYMEKVLIKDIGSSEESFQKN